MKKKLIYIFCGIAIVIAIGFTASKFAFPFALSEQTTSQTFSLTETSVQLTEISESQNTPEAEIVTSSYTIADSTTKPITTIKQTEKETVEKTKQPTKQTTEQNKPALTLPIPEIQIPKPVITLPITKPSATSKEETEPINFDNCAFLGNSRFVSFKNYGLAKNVYPVVGLNVDTVFTKSVSGSNVTVINELNGKDYDKVILMFGDNECGWPNQNVFIKKYASVIAAVRERIPNAEIYLHAILPISAEASAKNEYGCNNNTINSLNDKIKQLAADEGVYFIEQPPCLMDSNGALLPEAASDGIHLNKKYSEIWINYLAETII